MGGGHILLGVTNDEDDFSETYTVCGVENPDQTQQDIASGCVSYFNRQLRPEIEVETINHKTVIVVFISESEKSQKPIYFANQSLPQAARRRIGPTDRKCTEDDLQIFYAERSSESYDRAVPDDVSMDDLDLDEVEYFRALRKRVNPAAEELRWSDEELLESISAIRKVNAEYRPTLTGLLLFGRKAAQRRLLPTERVDYIRVAGTTWVEDPEQRFENTIDMRGPLLRLVDRALAAVVDDLPKGFRLEPGQVQAETPALPPNALREAIINAVMHRSYRERQPIQIIRYHNRIEIHNAGFSLKPEEDLGQPRSELRNPNLAAVFHETNTAETKGSGIRVMRRLMREAGFSPPTFQSGREKNFFTARFLLAHFLNDEDVRWLEAMGAAFTEAQKMALIFLREQGAIDNTVLRQLTDCDTLAASSELRRLRDQGFLEKKGGGPTTYYTPGAKFLQLEEKLAPLEGEVGHLGAEVGHLEGEVGHLGGEVGHLGAEVGHLGGEVGHLGAEVGHLGGEVGHLDTSDIPPHILVEIQKLGKRPGQKIIPVILTLCQWRGLSSEELSKILKRHQRGLYREYIKPLLGDKRLKLKYPEMPNHPDQAYITTDKGRQTLEKSD